MPKTDEQICKLIDDLKYPGLDFDMDGGAVLNLQKPAPAQLVRAFLQEAPHAQDR